MEHERTCTDCERPARKGGKQCARCYAKRYRATENGRRRTFEAVYRYQIRHPEKRQQWVHTWQERIGVRVPDLQALRRAIKTLDRAVETAAERQRVRGAGQPRRHDGPQQ